MIYSFEEFVNERNKIKDVQKELESAPIGSTVTGGGYEFEKIKNNTFKSPRGILKHSAAIASMLGGFNDFKIS